MLEREMKEFISRHGRNLYNINRTEMFIQKSSKGSKNLQVHQKAVVQQTSANNKQLTPVYKQLYQLEQKQTYKKNIHIKFRQSSNKDQYIEDRKLHSKKQVKKDQQQRHHSVHKEILQQKISTKEEIMTEKHSLYRNQQKIKLLITKSNQKRRMMPYSLTLPFKTKQNVQKNEERERYKDQQSFDKQQKSNFFTINRKQLRKRKKRDNKSTFLNYRIVNLFESLKEKINTVRKNDENTIMGLNLKQYLDKMGKSNMKFTQSYKSTHQTIHTQILHSKVESIAFDKHLKTTQESPEISTIFQHIKKRDKIPNDQDKQKAKQFQLKPWSTRQIVI